MSLLTYLCNDCKRALLDDELYNLDGKCEICQKNHYRKLDRRLSIVFFFLWIPIWIVGLTVGTIFDILRAGFKSGCECTKGARDAFGPDIERPKELAWSCVVCGASFLWTDPKTKRTVAGWAPYARGTCSKECARSIMISDELKGTVGGYRPECF